MNRPWKSEDSSSWAVHFAGGQEIKWALDEDLRWVRRALDGHVRPTSPWRSQIVHAAWWPSAWLLGTEVLADQKVICFSDNAPSFYARQPEFHAVRPFVDKWIARSREAVREFLSFGIQAEFAPYCVDPKVFFPLPAGDADVQALRRQLGLPKNSYVIGNFHSDTAFTLGPDRPKWQKGPDIFAEIVRQVRKVEPAVCVLLAGPRRHWLRQRLQDCGVPVFFVGRAAEGDDFGVNILDRSDLNRLYNLLDLCLITSRWEGGPHSILEACFAKTKLLSTRVGISEDVLEGVSLFNTIPEAVSGVVHDIRERSLGRYVRSSIPQSAQGEYARRNFLRKCTGFTNRCHKSRPKASVRPDAACCAHSSGTDFAGGPMGPKSSGYSGGRRRASSLLSSRRRCARVTE